MTNPNARKLLTICVPTFNRRNTIKKRVHNYVSLSRLDQINILIADNCSKDGTFEYLSDTFKDISNVSVIQHHRNIGAARNLIQFFDVVETDYLMFCSDEDEVITENIGIYLDFLAVEKPNYVRGNYFKQVGGKKKLKRRCANGVIERLSSKNLSIYSTYISGLVFNTTSSKDYIDLFKKNIKTSSYTNFFPHQELLFWLWAKFDQGFYFICAPVVFKCDDVEKDVISNDCKSRKGFREWESVDYRWKIFIDKLDALVEISTEQSCHEKFTLIIEEHKTLIFDILYQAIDRERPDVLHGRNRAIFFHLKQIWTLLMKPYNTHALRTKI